jgi:hypothetical protein
MFHELSVMMNEAGDAHARWTTVRPTKRAWLGLALAMFLTAPLLATPAEGRGGDCRSLPPSALKPRTCSPREECLRLIPKNVEGPRLEARRRECSQQPTAGTCYGPESYDPRKDCRERQRK